MNSKIISSLTYVALISTFFLTLAKNSYSVPLDPGNSYQLLTIKTDEDNNKLYNINLEIDNDSNIIRGQFEDEIYTIEQLINKLKRGIVLQKSEGIDVMVLSSHDMSAESGGSMELKYLMNGILRTYDKFKMQLRRDGHQWALYTEQDKIINTLFIETNKFLGIDIGIKNILVNNF
ncbi:MAG: hypothetical protein HQK51_06030 [Oligoflexia bacterium]|nr:hypothetical protein [Oligoflexia bacterium]